MKLRLSKLRSMSMTELMDIFLEKNKIKMINFDMDHFDVLCEYLGHKSQYQKESITMFLKENPEAIERLVDYIVEKDYDDWKESMARSIFKSCSKNEKNEIDNLHDEIEELEIEIERNKPFHIKFMEAIQNNISFFKQTLKCIRNTI